MSVESYSTSLEKLRYIGIANGNATVHQTHITVRFCAMILLLVNKAALLGRRQSTGQVRRVSTDRPALQLCVPAYFVWGANTGVGKTLVSAGLAAAAVRMKVKRTCDLILACISRFFSQAVVLFSNTRVKLSRRDHKQQVSIHGVRPRINHDPVLPSCVFTSESDLQPQSLAAVKMCATIHKD